jgi:small subunit ribosomal protein S9
MAVVASKDILGTGRRKTSVARVRIRPGEGKILINNRALDEYFASVRQRNSVLAPLNQTGRREQLNVVIRVDGGGISGQADACKLGIARALKKSDDQLADGLRDSGMLTRDGRMKERKKYGLRGARRGTQFSKR